MRAKVRTATLKGINPDDLEGTEQRWNDWVRELNTAGLRPADEPIRWTEDSLTYRVFSLADEAFPVTLNLNMARIITAGGAVAAFVTAEAFSSVTGMFFSGLPGVLS